MPEPPLSHVEVSTRSTPEFTSAYVCWNVVGVGVGVGVGVTVGAELPVAAEVAGAGACDGPDPLIFEAPEQPADRTRHAETRTPAPRRLSTPSSITRLE